MLPVALTDLQPGFSALPGLSATVPRRSGRQSRVRGLQGELLRMLNGTIHALSTALELKSTETGLHAARLGPWAVRVAERMGMAEDELVEIEIASVLHDIGKIGIPDAILNKPGRLTEEETAIVRQHPTLGWAILRSIPVFEAVSLLVLHHHERFDGDGYPSGLAGAEIPLGARILAVVDTFDAMLSDRPYSKGLEVAEILRRLEPEHGAQFDGQILSLFFDVALESLDEVADS